MAEDERLRGLAEDAVEQAEEKPNPELEPEALTDEVTQVAAEEEAASDAEGEGREPERAPEPKRNNRPLLIALVVALAAAAGLGLALCGRPQATPEAEDPGQAEEQTDAEPEEEQEVTTGETPEGDAPLTGADVLGLLPTLEWAGTDVSVDPESGEARVSVTVEGEDVWVYVTSDVDPADAPALAAERSAALAKALGDRAGKVTWVERASVREPHAAVTFATGGKLDDGADLPALLTASEGYALSAEAHAASGLEGAGVPRTGGSEPARPGGTAIVPEPVAAPEEGPEDEGEAEEGDAEGEAGESDGGPAVSPTDAGKSTTGPSGASEGGSGSGSGNSSSGRSGGNASSGGTGSSLSGGSSGSGGSPSSSTGWPSSGSTSGPSSGASSGGSSSSGNSGSSTKNQVWVDAKTHWEVCGTCGGSGIVSEYVLISSAWDEQVEVDSVYVFSDGYRCSTSAEVTAHAKAVGPDVNLSYWVEPVYSTVHHPEQYGYENRYCGTCGGNGGWTVTDVPGHWE